MPSETEKRKHVNFARSLLQSYDERGDEMPQRNVAVDETWVRFLT